MKRLLTIFAFVLVAFMVDAQSTQKGDINGDGDISVNDVAMIVNYILGIIDSNFIITNADINGDGEIDINDVMDTVSTILEGLNNENPDTPEYPLSCPDNNHPHAIDLGLPSGTKWACCNVGATVPEGYGGYYAWGETTEKSVYNDVTYIYATGVDEDGDGLYDDNHNDTGYKGVWQYLGEDIAGTQYDVAHVKWGGSWVMPSCSQMEELVYNSFYTGATINGVNGEVYFGSNDNCIFLPAAGYHWKEKLEEVGEWYQCWSSTPILNTNDAVCLYWGGMKVGGVMYHRSAGYPVRPVWVP